MKAKRIPLPWYLAEVPKASLGAALQILQQIKDEPKTYNSGLCSRFEDYWLGLPCQDPEWQEYGHVYPLRMLKAGFQVWFDEKDIADGCKVYAVSGLRVDGELAGLCFPLGGERPEQFVYTTCLDLNKAAIETGTFTPESNLFWIGEYGAERYELLDFLIQLFDRLYKERGA